MLSIFVVAILATDLKCATWKRPKTHLLISGGSINHENQFQIKSLHVDQK